MKRLCFPLCLLLVCGPGLSEDGGEGGFRDDFQGKFSEAWTILNHNPNTISFEKDREFLTIITETGGIWNRYDDAKNVFLVNLPPGCDNFVMTTRLVKFDPRMKYQQAGLLCFDDADNYLKFAFEFDPGNGGQTLAITPEVDGVAHVNAFLKMKPAEDGQAEDVWLRIIRLDQGCICAASRDGKEYRTLSVLNWKNGPPLKVGLIAKNGAAKAALSTDASFDFFEIVPLDSKPEIAAWAARQTEF